MLIVAPKEIEQQFGKPVFSAQIFIQFMRLYLSFVVWNRDVAPADTVRHAAQPALAWNRNALDTQLLQMHTSRYTNNQRGFTLVEVMVALVIFSVSLLGLAALQTSALRNSHMANQNTVATQLARDMAERLRANRQGVASDLYDNISGISSTAPDCYSQKSSCTPAQIAQLDSSEWLTAVNSALPSGTGTVQDNGTGFTITVMWDQDRTGATGTSCSGNPSVDLKCLSFTVQP